MEVSENSNEPYILIYLLLSSIRIEDLLEKQEPRINNAFFRDHLTTSFAQIFFFS